MGVSVRARPDGTGRGRFGAGAIRGGFDIQSADPGEYSKLSSAGATDLEAATGARGGVPVGNLWVAPVATSTQHLHLAKSPPDPQNPVFVLRLRPAKGEHQCMDTVLSYPYDVVLGDIGIINGWIVTPNGAASLQGAQWIVADRTWTYTYLPTGSVILGLLLLCIPFVGWILAIPVMMSQTTAVTGCVEVTVLTRGLIHLTQIPVSTTVEIWGVHALIQALRSYS